ncbi:basigin [Vanessa tameamea]|uniref:Basigin n=1 Tax=Vanessa tameamea TaxID=334116 RepID=A0A8B8I407_VANTA|nr:basigin [Vanessa tameamea]
MGRTAFCVPLAILFLASVIPSKAQSDAPAPVTAPAPAAAPASASAPSEDLPELLYDVRGNFSLHCQLPNDNSLAYVWKKNETDIEQVWELKDRYQLERGGAEFRVARAYEDDFGNYSCALAGAAREQRWAVRGRPHLKLPANTNVVEGQKLKLVCKVVGKPYSRVTWGYTNSSEPDANYTDATEVLGSRASLADSEQGVPNGVLLLEEAQRSDAGRYRCGAAGALAPAVTTLRVKDMYAALWPFLGICAEVFVLCAIILVYEKRRTKPELDDSDTDNHDQKKS